MSESRWELLQGLARSRGYELAADGDKLTLSPRIKLSTQPKSSTLTQSLNDAGIEAASKWLQGKRKLFNPWSFL